MTVRRDKFTTRGGELMARRSALGVVTLLVLSFGIVPSAGLAQSVGVVRGRIVDSLGQPITQVELNVAAGDEARTTRTGDDGRFRVVFPQTVAAVTLVARRVGYQPLMWRAVDSTGTGTIVADQVLRASAGHLPPILTIASQSFPTMDRPRSITGGRETGLRRTGPVADPANLDELLSVLPGALPDSGTSLAGGQRQTAILLDGMRVDASLLPPDVLALLGYSAASPDLSRGSSDGELSLTTYRGGDSWRWSFRSSAAHPSVAWADPRSLSVPFRSILSSGSLSGPLVHGKSHVFLSWSTNDRSSRSVVLPWLGDERLARAGFEPDTLARVVAALDALGAPTRGPGAQRSSERALWLKTDWVPTASSFLELTFWPTWSRREAPASGTSAFPSIGNRSRSDVHTGLFRLTTALGDWAAHFRSALTLTSDEGDPTVAGPRGLVRVPTSFPTGPGRALLGFGGADSRMRSSTTRWDSKFEQERALGRYNTLRTGQQIEFTWQRSLSAANEFGTFRYESLADIEVNRPALYSRLLDASESSSRTAVVSVWASDEWKRSRRFNFSTGARLDALTAAPAPRLNPLVASTFGLRTDQLPNPTAFTVRAGFGWVIREGRFFPPFDQRRNGTNDLIQVLSPVPDPNAIGLAPGLTLRGNVGSYRTLPPAARFSELIAATGLPGVQRLLTCVGEASPVPNWEHLSSNPSNVPVECVDGTAAEVFRSAAPAVRVFDRDFRPVTTWKANLGMLIPNRRWSLYPDVLIQRTTNIGSSLDVNRRTTVFTLPGEAGRPMFVNPEDVDVRTGQIAPAAGRVDATLGSVQTLRSDLSSYMARISLRAYTERAIGILPLDIAYTLRFGRDQVRGTGMDPAAIEWTRSGLPTHHFTIITQGFYWAWFTVGASYQLSSGRRYTPLVAGDVNGDHRTGDRAFIPRPGTVADPELAEEFDALLERAPAGARRCLLRQVNRIAGYHSCTGPWTGRFDLAFNFIPPSTLDITPRLRFTTQVFNAGGAIVRLLGLRDTPLASAAPSASLEQTLFYVRSFDPTARSFRYQVNQQFGGPIDRGREQRTFAPFQVQVGLQYSLAAGPRRSEDRLVKSLGLLQADGQPVSRDSAGVLLLQWYARNPVGAILADRDTLLLRNDQVRRLEQLRQEFDTRLDPYIAAVADYIVRTGRRLDDRGLSEQLNSVRPLITDLIREYQDSALTILTVEQRLRLENLRRGGE